MMTATTLHRPARPVQAIALLRSVPQAQLLGGGTELVPLTRSGLVAPGPLVSVRGLGLSGITLREGWLQLGAGTTLAEAARSPLVQQHAPVLGEALRASASPQVRNLATLAGNLLQRTRCPYFRGQAAACNRRAPGSGCAVRSGEQRQAAIFGASAACCATHASDLAVALAVLDAEVQVLGPQGERAIALDALYPELAGAGPEHTLAADELMLGIALPLSDAARRASYLKLRDRASFQFAVLSLAVALEFSEGRITRAALAAGGVGPRPWRLRASEAALLGQPAGPEAWQAAAEAATQGATPLPGNAFKPALLRRCVQHALARQAECVATPPSGDPA